MDRSLPIELWNDIIATLPPSEQRQCLSVCRTLHKISIHFVFSTVRIYFGLPHDLMTNTSENDEIQMMSQSWDILDHIANDAIWARAVKKVVVLAFARGHTIFQRRSLAKALKSLPHLRSFQWFGPSPYLTWDIAEALGSHCTGLDDVRFPNSRDVPLYLPTSLARLQSLQTLSLMAIDNVDNGPCEAIDCFCPHSENFQDIADLIATNLSTLRILSLPGDQIGKLPVRTFTSLTELDIIESSELSGLDLICHHAVNLQSLIIQGDDDVDVFSILKNNPSALPALTSFKIISLVSFDEPFGQAISVFIQGRSLLRRLDLGLLPANWTTFAIFLPMIADLHGLKALGLTIPLKVDDYSLITRYLPIGLEALRLKVDLSQPLMDHGPLAVIMQKLKEMPSLAFVSLHRYGSSRLYPFAEDIASDLRQLSLLYLDRNIWDVDRIESKVVLSLWSLRRKYLKMKEDFESQDAEWLFRHGDFPPLFP